MSWQISGGEFDGRTQGEPIRLNANYWDRR